MTRAARTIRHATSEQLQYRAKLVTKPKTCTVCNDAGQARDEDGFLAPCRNCHCSNCGEKLDYPLADCTSRECGSPLLCGRCDTPMTANAERTEYQCCFCGTKYATDEARRIQGEPRPMRMF